MRKYIDALIAAYPVLKKAVSWFRTAWRKLTAVKYDDTYDLGGHDEDEDDK